MLKVFAVSFTVISILAGSLTAASPQFDKMFVIGDSISDNGNLFAITGGLLPPPPYWQGRASDGPVWCEYLAERLELPQAQVHNYAVIGAQSGFGLQEAPPSISEPLGLTQGDLRIPSTGHQIQQAQLSNPPTEDSLVVIWVGANDLFFGQANNSVSVSNISQHIRHMAILGAKTFLIPNVPPLEKTPFGLFLDETTREQLRIVSIDFNHQLKQELDALSLELSVTIVQFDIHSLLNNVIAVPEAYGFQDVTTPSIIFTPFEVEGFLFFDDVHPTTQAHKVLSEEASTAICDSVPAP